MSRWASFIGDAVMSAAADRAAAASAAAVACANESTSTSESPWMNQRWWAPAPRPPHAVLPLLRP